MYSGTPNYPVKAANTCAIGNAVAEGANDKISVGETCHISRKPDLDSEVDLVNLKRPVEGLQAFRCNAGDGPFPSGRDQQHNNYIRQHKRGLVLILLGRH